MSRRILLALCGSLACRTPPSVGPEPASPRAELTAPADPLRERLESLDHRIEAELERSQIAGAALVIVRDGEVIHTRGFGRRAVDAETPVTADTLFAIGSTTKAFTAMLVMMAVEAGKLSLDDHPRKCVPGFRLRDADADARITVRDLLTHSSGLMGTDLAWITGQLSSEELVALLGEAEPTAPLRTSFQYQNVMYLAAGMCAARALAGEYEQLLRARILAPIGIGTATLSITRMQQRPDFAKGHHRQPGGELREIAMRNLDAIAPAGGLNASAVMLGNWLRLLLAGGVWQGKPLIGRRYFQELLAPQFDAGPELAYTLGWLRSRWGEDAQLSHTGGIDGFSTLVAMLPARRIGFALLTNVDNADVHGMVTREVFGLLDETAPAAAPALADPDALVGTYGVLGGFKVELLRSGEGLALRVPGQPPYPLELERGLRFRLGTPAPAGFFAELRDRDGARELLLQQPFGDLHLAKLDEAELEAAAHASAPAELRELMGVYRIEGKPTEVELAELEGGVSLVVPGQPPARLVTTARDRYALAG
ncbi:MAG: beta-lactamase family protein, partial [Deltaproteobacteria bacterium]|nr:beta-lactamase family protein [Nannocystaceae bacterium]